MGNKKDIIKTEPLTMYISHTAIGCNLESYVFKWNFLVTGKYTFSKCGTPHILTVGVH